MLAYELFLNNKNSQSMQVKNERPIKKIFYNNNKCTIDKKTIEEYGGSCKTSDYGKVQICLKMPLNTVDANSLNLPDFRTGSASPNPYVEIYATLKKTNLELIIGNKKKSKYIKHVLDLQDYTTKKYYEGKTTLKLDKKNYLINSKPLFTEYVKSGIIDDKGVLNALVYDDIIRQFFTFVEKQGMVSIKYSVPFRIFILPDQGQIEFKDKAIDADSKFVDHFGNESCTYASTPTKTAKFLTYDDPAFTINCKQKQEFYKNLGIGTESLDKVYIDSRKTFTISGLEWTFVNILEPNLEFKEARKGFLYQIYDNYQNMKENTRGISEDPQMKIICIKKNQAKQEILIDENITMDKMKVLFDNMNNIPPVCFEIFIEKSGTKSIWNMYLNTIKNFLAGHKIQKDYMVAYFSRILKQKIHEWLKTTNITEQVDFFHRSNFCLQHLSIHNVTESYMSKSEKYAQGVGRIARTYINFKQTNNETDNSMMDILTYSKYDREKLRFVVSRIGRGINLSKSADEKKNMMTKRISSLLPNEEIPDDVAAKDYSYFFYKGYYDTT